MGIPDGYNDYPSIVGQNNADNAEATDLVVANADGTIVERLEALKAQLAAIASTDLGAVLTAIEGAGFNTAIDSLKILSDQIDLIKAGTDTLETPSNTSKRLAGKTQIFTKNITSAANAGLVTIGTVTNQSVLIKRIVLMSNGVTTADLTSAAIKGGDSQIVEFISAATAVKANIDTADEQVSYSGAKKLKATKTIVVDLQGTGATAVDLTVCIEYCSVADGGYIV